MVETPVVKVPLRLKTRLVPLLMAMLAFPAVPVEPPSPTCTLPPLIVSVPV